MVETLKVFGHVGFFSPVVAAKRCTHQEEVDEADENEPVSRG
jgi:hypothetical protein